MPDAHTYVVRFPFRLAPGQEFGNLTDAYIVDETERRIRLGAQSGMYFISVECIPSEDDGRKMVLKLWAGMMWALLQRGIAAQMSLVAQDVSLNEDPIQAAKSVSVSFGLKVERLDAIIDGALPAVYGSDKAIKIMTGQNVNLRHGHAPAQTIDCVREALSMPHPESVATDPKLQVALDLYNAFFWETSANARFINLNIALEALAPVKEKHECALVLVERWMAEVDQLLSSSRDATQNHAYESLKREIGFRRGQSIRSNIRELVHSSLKGTEADADRLSARAVALYDIRGQLVHEGHVPGVSIGQSADELREIVRLVLKVHFLRNSGVKISEVSAKS